MYGRSVQHGKLSLRSKQKGDDSVSVLSSVLQDPWICEEMGIYIHSTVRFNLVDIFSNNHYQTICHVTVPI